MFDTFALHWFPGHMAKARRQLGERVKQVDFLVEVVDARAPRSTRNPELDEIAEGLPRLLVFAKADLAETGETRAWAKALQGKGLQVIAASFLDGRDVRKVKELVERFATGRRSESTPPKIPGVSMPNFRAPKSRGMVVGIPNTGKSSLIRALGGGKIARGNRPGVTRGVQDLVVSPNVTLLDTPGILWPRAVTGLPALRLAWLGSVGERSYDSFIAGECLAVWLARRHPSSLMNRYAIMEKELSQSVGILKHIASARGRFIGGEPDASLGAEILLRDFRDGHLGRLTLDEVAEREL